MVISTYSVEWLIFLGEVSMDLKDEVVVRTVRVFDLAESWTANSSEIFSALIFGA